MSIIRSKSAPTLEIPSGLVVRDAGTMTPPIGPRRAPRRSKQRLASTTVSSPLRSPLETPREEDPFNMGGFFPAHVSALSEEDEEWSWLHRAEPEKESHAAQHSRYPLFSPVDSEGESSVPATPKDLEFELEEQAKKVLQEEDKLGILHLGNMFVGDAQSRLDEQHLLSPYTGDQPENDDALYNGLRALRCAYSVPDAKKAEDYKLGELFLPESGVEEPRSARWVSSLSRWLWA